MFQLVRCAIWYRLRNLKNVKKTREGVLLLVELQASAALLKVTLLHRFFFTFLNCTNKSHNASHEFNVGINPFLYNVPILNPLKAPKNLWFSDVFKGYQMKPLARSRLNRISVRNIVCEYCYGHSVHL